MECDFFDSEQAELFIRRVFLSEPERLRHSLVVAERVRQSARDINELNPGTNIDEERAYCAALVHDIGYCEPAKETGFHPLDGYNYLCAHGAAILAQLIAGHSSAPEEARLYGFSLPKASDDLIAKLITYWDMQVKQGGEIVGYQERYLDIMRRYGEASTVGQAHASARVRIEEIIAEIDRLLKKIPE